MYCAVIESAVLEKDEVIFKGEIPACCISEYKNDLIFYTNGRSVCLTELKGYKEISGGFISQPHCPDRRLSFTNNVINFRKNHPENCTHKQKEGQLNVAKMNISNQTVKSN